MTLNTFVNATTNATMLAMVWNGNPYEMDLLTVPKPSIVNQTDAIIRISSAAICGTDLHTYHGIYGSTEPGWIQGHEAVGYVEAVGSGVNFHRVGDYVVLPDNFGTGHLNLEPGSPFATGLGPDYSNAEYFGGYQGKSRCCPVSQLSAYTDRYQPNTREYPLPITLCTLYLWCNFPMVQWLGTPVLSLTTS